MISCYQDKMCPVGKSVERKSSSLWKLQHAAVLGLLPVFYVQYGCYDAMQ